MRFWQILNCQTNISKSEEAIVKNCKAFLIEKSSQIDIDIMIFC